MVSETLSVLTVHVIWKAKALPPSSDRSPEEERLAESLLEQRASVVEKLIEYAVGTNSNTIEGVRRAVGAAFDSDPSC
jgi:cohesin complex subunit SA-1/2